jgi:hypothetical protein
MITIVGLFNFVRVAGAPFISAANSAIVGPDEPEGSCLHHSLQAVLPC